MNLTPHISQAVTAGKRPCLCSYCSVREICLPAQLNAFEMVAADQIVHLRKTIKKGNRLFRASMKFHAIYTIRSGFFKTTLNTVHGDVHLLNFHMKGDSMGLDGIAFSRYQSDAVALEDSEVCVIPFDEIEQLSRNSPSFQRHFLQRLSQEIVREHQGLRLLSQLTALQRVAGFVHTMSHRLHAQGFSRHELLLRMTRIEMAQHLGLTQETVCRTLTKLCNSGVLSINRRHLHILNMPALDRMTGNQV